LNEKEIQEKPENRSSVGLDERLAEKICVTLVLITDILATTLFI